MIAAWMIYTLAVTVLLFAAASAAEYIARALRAPTRLVWAAAMVAAVGLSARALVVGLDARHAAQRPAQSISAMHVVYAASNPTAAIGPVAQRGEPARESRLESLLIGARSAVGALSRSADRVDVRPLERWNQTFLLLWLATSLVALAWLGASLMGLRRIERELALTTVDDHPVLLSKDVGPALFGILRSRIVLPEWVLTLPKSEREVILAHEAQHAAAFDPALVYAAALIVALQPWNLALWAMLARLRLALESDCDRRVLSSMGDARRYGRLLVAVYEHMTPGLSPYVAFVKRPSNLERRIRRITRRPRLISMAGATSVFAAAVLVATACTAAAPARRAISPVTASSPPVPRVEKVAAATPPVPRAEKIAAATPPTVNESVPQVVERTREEAATTGRPCELFDRVAWALPTNRSPNAPPIWDVIRAGCSIHGDVVVVAIDSSHVLAAARDTADVWSTAFFVFETKAGTVPANLAWSTTGGRVELTDTTYYYASAVAGTKPLAFHLPSMGPAKTISGAQRLEVLNIAMMQMRGIAWDLIAHLPTAARCTTAEQTSPTLQDLGIRPRSSATDSSENRACFIIRGQRFQVLVP